MSNDYYDVDNDVMMLTMPRMIIEISSASWSSALYRGSCFTMMIMIKIMMIMMIEIMMIMMIMMIIKMSSTSRSSALYRGSCFTKRFTNVCSPFYSDVCANINNLS